MKLLTGILQLNNNLQHDEQGNHSLLKVNHIILLYYFTCM